MTEYRLDTSLATEDAFGSVDWYVGDDGNVYQN